MLIDEELKVIKRKRRELRDTLLEKTNEYNSSVDETAWEEYRIALGNFTKFEAALAELLKE